mmetsp:Transcript_11297/g.26145  ORF Transcript_11297/g.26145 Transcript_11297/m.26145 type:complete len:349 (-) Transcript_11297:91-1137(-)
MGAGASAAQTTAQAAAASGAGGPMVVEIKKGKSKRGGGAAASPVSTQELANREGQGKGRNLGAEYTVSLVKPALAGIEKGQQCILRIAYEALALVTADDKKTPLTIFKYQDIICWGSNTSVFQFKVFGHVFGKAKNDFEAIMFSTKKGKEIETVTLASVKSLMVDMDREGVSKDDFKLLKGILQNWDMDADEAGWFGTVRQFASSRAYTSHQGVELLQIMKQVNPFELIELACFLYDNILNRDSFQMLLNVFDDPADRDNIIHRLKLSSRPGLKDAGRKKSVALLQADCPNGLEGDPTTMAAPMPVEKSSSTETGSAGGSGDGTSAAPEKPPKPAVPAPAPSDGAKPT